MSLEAVADSTLQSAERGGARPPCFKKRWKKWDPGFCSRLRRYLQSPSLQLSLQLAAGQIVICVFTFVPAITFNTVCLASVFFVIGMLARQDNHVGSYIMSASTGVGSIVTGATTAGIVMTLAHLPGRHFTLYLIIWSAVGLLFLSTVRLCTELGVGIPINVVYGMAIIEGHFVWPVDQLWIKVVCYYYLTGLISGLAELASGILVVPTMAHDDLRDTAAFVVQSIGQAMTGYAGIIFGPERQPGTGAELRTGKQDSEVGKPWKRESDELKMAESDQGLGSLRSGNLSEALSTQGDDWKDHINYWDFLADASNPQNIKQGRRLLASHPSPQLADLRPQIMTTRRLLREMGAEPLPLMGRGAHRLEEWDAALDAISMLVTRLSALESIFINNDHTCALNEEEVQRLLGHDVVSLFRLLYSHAAASCSSLATAILAGYRREKGSLTVLVEPSWPVLELELAINIHSIVKANWANSAVTGKQMLYHPTGQVRAMLYVAALSSGVLEALAATECAVVEALGRTRIGARLRAASVDRRASLERAASGCLGLDKQEHTRSGTANVGPLEEALQRRTQTAPLRPRRTGSRERPSSLYLHSSERPLQRRELSHFNSPCDGAAYQNEDNEPPPQSAFAASSLVRSGSLKESDTEAVKDMEGNCHTRSLKVPLASRAVSERNGRINWPGPGMGRTASGLQMTDTASAGSAKLKYEELDQHSPSKRLGWRLKGLRWNVAALHSVRAKLWLSTRWLAPVVKALFAWGIATSLWQVYVIAIPKALASPSTLGQRIWQDRHLTFYWKFWTASAGTMALCLLLAAHFAIFTRQWLLTFVMTTVSVVLSEKVDTTVSKGALRIAGTVIGGLFGYLVMLRAEVASNPYALTFLTSLANFLAAPLCRTQYKYVLFLTLITSNSLILCQHKPSQHQAGNVAFFYSRVVDIVVAIVVTIAYDFILPWYATTASLEMLGEAYGAAVALLQRYHWAFAAEMRRPVLEAGGEALALGPDPVLDGKALRDEVVRPVASVQVSLKVEAVLWDRGLLATPELVRHTVEAMLVLQDRLAAVELLVQQKPIVSGRYSGASYFNFWVPMEGAMRKCLDSLGALGPAVNDVLRLPSLHKLEALKAAIDELQADRVQLRERYLQAQRVYTGGLQRGDAPCIAERTPDDAVRFQSVMFALTHALDKAVLVTRVILEDPFVLKEAHKRERHRGGGCTWLRAQLWPGSHSSMGSKAIAPLSGAVDLQTNGHMREIPQRVDL